MDALLPLIVGAGTLQLGRAALSDRLTLALGATSAVLLFPFRVTSAVLVLAGAALGPAVGL